MMTMYFITWTSIIIMTDNMIIDLFFDSFIGICLHNIFMVTDCVTFLQVSEHFVYITFLWLLSQEM